MPGKDHINFETKNAKRPARKNKGAVYRKLSCHSRNIDRLVDRATISETHKELPR